MRNRHFPRLCHACQAPMGAQLDDCWRCGVAWTSEPKGALRVVEGGAGTAAPEPGAATAERIARLIAEARA
jgi:hypothetical protein